MKVNCPHDLIAFQYPHVCHGPQIAEWCQRCGSFRLGSDHEWMEPDVLEHSKFEEFLDISMQHVTTANQLKCANKEVRLLTEHFNEYERMLRELLYNDPNKAKMRERFKQIQLENS